MLPGEVGGTHPGARSERVARGEDDDEFVVEQRLGFDAAICGRTRNDCQVDAAREESGERMVSGFSDNLDFDAGEIALEEFEPRGKPVVTGIALGGEAEGAGGSGVGAADFLLGAVEFGENLAGSVEQAAAGGREEHFFVHTIKEASAEVVFGGTELVAESRLGEVKAACGSGDAALLDDGGKQAQVAGVEGHGEKFSFRLGARKTRRLTRRTAAGIRMAGFLHRATSIH